MIMLQILVDKVRELLFMRDIKIQCDLDRFTTNPQYSRNGKKCPHIRRGSIYNGENLKLCSFVLWLFVTVSRHLRKKGGRQKVKT